MRNTILFFASVVIAGIVLFSPHVYAQSNPYRCCPAQDPCEPYDQYEGQWKPWPDKLALLSIQAHADDELYGCEWPYTLLVRKLSADRVLMSNGRVQAGKTRRGMNGCSIRKEERLNASRYYGSP